MAIKVVGFAKAVLVGLTAPINTKITWIDSNFTPNIEKRYDGAAWVRTNYKSEPFEVAIGTNTSTVTIPTSGKEILNIDIYIDRIIAIPSEFSLGGTLNNEVDFGTEIIASLSVVHGRYYY